MALNLSLGDVLSAPEDPELLKQHLLSIGAVAPPPAPPTAPSIAPMEPVKPVPQPAVPADFKAPTHFDKDHEGPGAITLSPGAHPTIPALGAISPVEAPSMGNAASPTDAGAAAPMEAEPIASGVQIPKLEPLNFKQRQALPTFSPGVQASANNPEFFQNQIERIEDQKANPYGSAENHPGVIGHILHGLAKAGNIAGDIVAPGVMANVPGTEMNRAVREQTAEKNEAGAETRQVAEEESKTKALHESNLSDTNQQKLDQLQQKIDETNRHNLSTEDYNLRKQGLMKDPANPGKNIPVPEDQMSDDEKAVLRLKSSKADQAEAAALVNQLKADPNSPQNAQARQRLKIMAQNAGTAAERVGLSKAEYLRDTLGLDIDGNPLPGITYDEKTNKPIGTKVAHAAAENNPGAERLKRSDLAYNVLQNSEDIRKLIRDNPDLFGKISGRISTVQELIGTDDPALHKIGIAMHNVALASNGAHGLRSAEAVKETEDKLLNHFRNGTDATIAGLDEIDKSVQSFIDAAKMGKKPMNAPTDTSAPEAHNAPAPAPRDLGVAPQGSHEGRTGTLPDGTKIIVKNGRIVENK